MCLLAPPFDPRLLCITNIALGVEAHFLQYTIFCPQWIQIRSYPAEQNANSICELQVILAHTCTFERLLPSSISMSLGTLPLLYKRFSTAASTSFRSVAFSLFCADSKRTPLPTILVLNGQSSVSCKLGQTNLSRECLTLHGLCSTEDLNYSFRLNCK